MTDRDFCYWLNGYFDLSTNGGLTKEQVDIIKEKLREVFSQVLPFNMGNQYPVIIPAPTTVPDPLPWQISDVPNYK